MLDKLEYKYSNVKSSKTKVLRSLYESCQFCFNLTKKSLKHYALLSVSLVMLEQGQDHFKLLI